MLTPRAGGDPVQAKAARGTNAVQLASGGNPVQRVGEGLKWVAGIDIATASTYDAGGGHSFADHGAQTTKEQHQERLKSGKTPSGRTSKVPGSAPGSSKFNSDAAHQAALKAAATQLEAKNPGGVMSKGVNGKIGVSPGGTMYKGDGTEEACTDVHVDVQVVGGALNINTAFPTQ